YDLGLTVMSESFNVASAKAEELAADGAVLVRQSENQAIAEIHRSTTGPEIRADTDGKVDIFVSGIGTGGTITGAGATLREANPDVKIVAVEPAASPILSEGKAG